MHLHSSWLSAGSEQTLAQKLREGRPWMLITVSETQGSVPRSVGTWMAVTDDEVMGTIGGGQLEFQAIAKAREGLQRGQHRFTARMPLGPSLGQCCGGVVILDFERLQQADARDPAGLQRLAMARRTVALFGGGHVGHALVSAIMPLPYRIHWVDSRDEIFPADLPMHVVAEHSDPVQASVGDLPPDSAVLIMSFSHAEDLDIVAECLKRQRESQDLPFVGLIGSRTKWATFRHRLTDRGFKPAELDAVTCPIGLPGITGKQPEVIAAAVVAQLLMVHPPQALPHTS